MHVCVCVCERETERECVCVWVHVFDDLELLDYLTATCSW